MEATMILWYVNNMELRVDHIRSYIFIFLLLSFASCQKEIEVELPDVPVKLVVDGTIELDAQPIIILTKSQGYFDQANLEAIAASFVDDADITISDGTTTQQMIKLCSSGLTSQQIRDIAQSLQIDTSLLQEYNICAYTSTMVGEENKTYTITISWRDEVYTSETSILQGIPLDSLWFEEEPGTDSLGFIGARLSDPAGQKNFYHWAAKRINKYTYGDLEGQQKDNQFLSPRDFVFSDEFIDGQSIDLTFSRNRGDRSRQDEDNNERGRFKRGDTVVVKFSVIEKEVYDFITYRQIQQSGSDSPFASPVNVPSNISNNALGLWAGYGFVLDTLVCK